MRQSQLMRGIIFSGLGLVLWAGFFVPFQLAQAAVLYEQSKTGTPYDLFQDVGTGYGYYIKMPQYTGEPPLYQGGGEAYSGTAEWLRVKRISGLSCDSPFNVTIIATDGQTRIGDAPITPGVSNGDYCDFPITGPNRTDMEVGGIFICLNGDCDGIPSFVLDGSPQNEGFVSDGTQTAFEPGGWAFQICDLDGCSGGFEVATSTGTTTDPGTGTTTATSTGASSVLFLPGIMGSRLYEESPELVCDMEGGEMERWFSQGDCDQLRLITDGEGDSVYDIYTKDENDAVIDETLGLNLYKTFFQQLATWKAEKLIKDYALVPYDWRLRLDELLTAKVDPLTGEIRLNPGGSIEEGYIYSNLKELSGQSFNDGKVTVVAHSNGGLLAKAFLAKLDENDDPLLKKIDNLILIASPQVGTPDTIMGMLHGTEIGPAGTVVSEQTSRILLNTMPFGFHLLPNASYFDGNVVTVDTPVISFEQGTVTAQWINSFGQTITDVATMERFMTIDSGRLKPEPDDLEKPEVVPKYLFDNYTKNIDTLLNTWVPPETMQVKEVAGVGVETLSGLTYFTDKECVARNPLLLFKCSAYVYKLGMRPETIKDGDNTVVAPSAFAISDTYQNVERWWLNLEKYNEQNTDIVHKNIFEVADIGNFVFDVISANTSIPYQYLTNTPANLAKGKKLTFTLHSPLDIMVTDSRGTVSSSTVTIDGGVYRRFGEVQYISIPDSGRPATVKLSGEAMGSFTLEVATFDNGTLDQRHSYSAIPSSTTTKATIVVDTDMPLATTPLQVDYDGNGINDITYDTKGEVIPVITYTTLIDTINALPVKSLYKKFLLENAKVAEQYNLKSQTNVKYKRLELIALEVLKQQVLLYERNKVLTSVQKQDLLRIINELSK